MPEEKNKAAGSNGRQGRAKAAAGRLWAGYRAFRHAFETVTRRAGHCFEARDWEGMRADTLERLDLYEWYADQTRKGLEDLLGPAATNHPTWMDLKAAFAEKAGNDPEGELACTFYNSVNRRIFQTVGIEDQLEFIAPRPSRHAFQQAGVLTYKVDSGGVAGDQIRAILSAYGFKRAFIHLSRDCELAARRLAHTGFGHGEAGVLEMLPSPFFRDTQAYLIGRLKGGDRMVPLVFSLGSGDQGLYLDAILQTQDQLRVLFSFSRAYFHVQTRCAAGLVNFLKDLMPRKRTAELYISLGFHKHGKTELYKALLDHRQVCSADLFEHARGQPGMVMIAFNMTRDDLIYKLIRDRFDQPKKTTRREIMLHYDFVFKHDRAGRLVDVQTFENLNIETCCFTPELLEEIAIRARQTVSVTDGQVILHHVYVERRVTPLDLYLKSASFQEGRAVVIDYGQAIKDLAQVNVFPGDLLIKNFGVTRLGRVVFYDYDELCPLTLCNFRRIPRARGYDDALEAEPWFAVAENDVFPEEFLAFLGLPAEFQTVLKQHHGDLLTPDYWTEVQDRIRAGAWMPILPYGDEARLRPGGS